LPVAVVAMGVVVELVLELLTLLPQSLLWMQRLPET
jgi:hypothetical protein